MTLTKLIGVFLFLVTATGCSIKGGQFSPETHFSFPNSNVTPLGQVKATRSKWSFLFSGVTEDDTLGIMKEALAQQAGADLVVNYVLDTKTTILPIFIYKTDIIFEGTAAKMTVGEKDLNSVVEQVQYRSVKNSLP